MSDPVDKAPTNYTFPNPDTISILGTRETEGRIYEADVRFDDFSNNQWYITILGGDGFIKEFLEPFETVSVDDVTALGDNVEPPKFVWNGELNETRIKDIISSSTVELLMPFLMPFLVELG